jgi:hypothetical protein
MPRGFARARMAPIDRFGSRVCSQLLSIDARQSADQAQPQQIQQSQSVTELAACGQLLMAASGQISMTVNKG